MNRLSAFCLLAAVVGLAACTASADTIELWNGQTAEDATVERIEEGFLYFHRAGMEEEFKVKLANVKTIRKPEVAAVELLALKKVTRDRKAWYGLGLKITDDEERMREPLIRVFVLDADSKGVRTAQYYTNRRSQDPTLGSDADEVDTESYQARYWQILADNPLAWHIEVWKDGDRIWKHDAISDEVKAELEPDWWQKGDYRRSAIMKEIDQPDRREGEVATRERETKADGEEAEPPPPVAVQITAAGIRGDLNVNEKTFAITYVIRSIHVAEVDLPKVNVYFLSETKSGTRRVTTLELAMGEGDGKLQNGMLTTSVEGIVPNNITHGLDTSLSENDLDEGKRKDKLLAWRVEVIYGDTVMHSKERGPDDLLASLPRDWYK